MTDDEALEFARTAFLAWGGGQVLHLIKNRENAVFETVLNNGKKAALRLHRPGYQSNNAIRSELWWAEALVAAGMHVPVPVRTISGDVLAQIPEAGRVASVVSWLEGTPLGEGDAPLSGTADEQVALHYALGAELAHLHLASDNAVLSDGFYRPVLDEEALLGEAPAWGRFWENPSLSGVEIEELQHARGRLRRVIGGHQATGCDFGLIHADALRENVLVQGGAVRLIDFDDGVMGFRMYELGVAMSQNWDQANRSALGRALLAGYASVRTLPKEAETLLGAFTVMRGLASCGWVIGRYSHDHSATRSYAVRALEMCRQWMAR